MFCPMCFKEAEMPRNPAGAAPSAENALPGEPGYIAPEADAAVTDTENITVAESDTPPVPEVIEEAAPVKPATAAPKTGKKDA
jgi:hypothetical protein